MTSHPISEYHEDHDAAYPSEDMGFEQYDSLLAMTKDEVDEMMQTGLDLDVPQTRDGHVESHIDPGVNASPQVQTPSFNIDQEFGVLSRASEQIQIRDTNSEQSLAVANSQAPTLEHAQMSLYNNEQNHETPHGSMMRRLALSAINPPPWPNTKRFDVHANSFTRVSVTRVDPQSIQSEMPTMQLNSDQDVSHAAEMPLIGSDSSVQPLLEGSLSYEVPQAQMTVHYDHSLQNQTEAYPSNGFRDQSNPEVYFENIDPNLSLVSTTETPSISSGPPGQTQTGTSSSYGVSQSMPYRAPQSQMLAHHNFPQQDFPWYHVMHQATTPLMSQSSGVEHLQIRSDYRFSSSVATLHETAMLHNGPQTQSSLGLNQVPNNFSASNLQSSTNNGMRTNLSKPNCPFKPFCPLHPFLQFTPAMPEEWWPLLNRSPQSSTSMDMSIQPRARPKRPASRSRTTQQATTALRKSSQTRRSAPSGLNQTLNNFQGSASDIFTAAMLKDVSMSMSAGTTPPTPSSLRRSPPSPPAPPPSGSMRMSMRRTSQKHLQTNFGQFDPKQDPNRYSSPDVPLPSGIKHKAQPDSFPSHSNRISAMTNMSSLDMGTEGEMTGYFDMNADTAPIRSMPQGSYRPLMIQHSKPSSAPLMGMYPIPKGPQRSSLRAFKKQPSTDKVVRKPRTKKQAS